MTTFQEELEQLINKYSKENGSDTPDFILAKYLEACLLAFDTAIRDRNRYYIGQDNTPAPPPTTCK